MPRIVVLGNSGSGKTTLARRLAARHGVGHLDLDAIAWAAPGERRPLAEAAAELRSWMAAREGWVVEGCYGDLLEVAAERATELRFLNPGVEACVAHCRARPWEPGKYASAAEQDARLEFLLAWVREYPFRDDEYSLARHRALFDAFPGTRREHTDPAEAEP
jgi:adenylate kinase family enzyme